MMGMMLNVADILNQIKGVSNMIHGIHDIVHGAQATLSSSDAEQIDKALAALQTANDARYASTSSRLRAAMAAEG